MRPWLRALRELTWLTQLGLSLVIPPFGCALGAWWLTAHAGAPAWIMAPALVLGLGAAAVSFYNFYRYTQRRAQRQKKPPAAFNDHT